MTVHLPPMLEAQRDAWWTLMDVHELMPTGWALVGGQMVHLHCAERDASPPRPTDDADAGIDVRAYPDGLARFTSALRALGLEPEGATWLGQQHRWRRRRVVVDVLIPRGLAESSRARLTDTGSTTLEAPGLQQALARAADARVDADGRVGTVRRPSLLGALVVKAAALEITDDPVRGRHLQDFVTLATLIEPSDLRVWDEALGPVDAPTKRDRKRLQNMLGPGPGPLVAERRRRR